MNHFVKGNPDLCIGCRTCLISCVIAHEGKRIFEIDPDGFDFNPKLHMVKTKKISVPVQCKHCEDPACMAACPNGCITIKDHAVSLDTSKCIGCKSCMEACPFGAIDMVTVMGEKNSDGSERIIANKCDLCAKVPGGPACVRTCPTDALCLVEEEDMEAKIENRRKEAARSLDTTKEF
ncbi:MAG: 4Fe-4S dicluster domain-containing protein [Clostridia bacterium]|nr:4Fe-4S dicluster domain-containing protein [Clostridia bacterium]